MFSEITVSHASEEQSPQTLSVSYGEVGGFNV
jgi:hypothetical protein